MKQDYFKDQKVISSIFAVIFTISILSTICFSQEVFLKNRKERFDFMLSFQLLEKGKSCFEQEKYKKAFGYFEKCIKQLPFNADAYFYSSRIQYKLMKYTEALNLIEKAKNDFKKFATLKSESQDEYYDRLRERKQQLEFHLIDLKAKQADSLQTMYKTPLESQIDAMAGKLSQVQELLRNRKPKVLKTPANYYYVHGNIYRKLKKYNESYGQFIKAVETDPEHGEALNNLANLNYMAKKYKEALYFINMAESKKLKINKKLKEAIVSSLKNSEKTKDQ